MRRLRFQYAIFLRPCRSEASLQGSRNNVSAAGCAGLIGAEHVRPGQIVIDVGVNTGADGKICGDADFSAVEPVVQAVTPVPGGVGAVTSCILMEHVVDAAVRSVQKPLQ